jgi:hypothetical protein
MATDRDQLIRTCFEARRSVTWLERVEPRLREQGLDAASIKSYWAEWYEQMEKTDWGRWQEEATRFSNAVLTQMRTDYFDRVDVLLMFRWLREKDNGERERFGQILNGTLERKAEPQEQSRHRGRER